MRLYILYICALLSYGTIPTGFREEQEPRFRTVALIQFINKSTKVNTFSSLL